MRLRWLGARSLACTAVAQLRRPCESRSVLSAAIEAMPPSVRPSTLVSERRGRGAFGAAEGAALGAVEAAGRSDGGDCDDRAQEPEHAGILPAGPGWPKSDRCRRGVLWGAMRVGAGSALAGCVALGVG